MLPLCILTVVLTIVTYELRKQDIVDLTFSLDGHKLLSVMVAYLVVSRADASFNRFWEARTLLGVALQKIRQISIHAAAFTNQELHKLSSNKNNYTGVITSSSSTSNASSNTNSVSASSNSNDNVMKNKNRLLSSYNNYGHNSNKADKIVFWRTMLRQHLIHMLHSTITVVKEEELTYAFIGVKSQHGEKEDNESPSQKISRRFESIPALSYAIHKDIVQNKFYLEKPLGVLHENRLHNFLLEFEQTINELCKFAATPYPFPVTQMTRILLFCWMFSLPFALVNKADEVYTTSVMMFFITYGFFGLEFISIELDDPFGDDLNDLDIDDFAKVVIKGINDDLYTVPKILN